MKSASQPLGTHLFYGLTFCSSGNEIGFESLFGNVFCKDQKKFLYSLSDVLNAKDTLVFVYICNVCNDQLKLNILLIDQQALQSKMTGQQTAVETLRKTAESLITSEGDLLTNPEEIQETVGEEKT